MVEFTDEEVVNGALMNKYINGKIVYKDWEDPDFIDGMPVYKEPGAVQYYVDPGEPTEFHYGNIEEIEYLQPIDAETKAEVDRLNAMQAVHGGKLQVICQRPDGELIVVSPSQKDNPCSLPVELYNSLTPEEVECFAERHDPRDITSPLAVMRDIDAGIVIW